MSSWIAISFRNGTRISRAAGASGPAQSRNHSVIVATVVFGTAPAWIIRKTAMSCVSLVEPRLASTNRCSAGAPRGLERIAFCKPGLVLTSRKRRCSLGAIQPAAIVVPAWHSGIAWFCARVAFFGANARSPRKRAYITAKRIECACAMLAATDERLCQIAIACGLCDRSHQCRIFR
jgi:AraC-like DNA-binding protein